LGHHPHLLQGVEKYGHGLIAYSLGNFQFEFDCVGANGNSLCGPECSMALSITMDARGIITHDIIPVVISDDFIPAPASGERARILRAFVDAISRPVFEGSITYARWIDEVAPAYISDSLMSWKKRVRAYGFRHLWLWGRWFMSPFVIRCYLSIFTGIFKRKPSRLAKAAVVNTALAKLD
jgi:poly-gamma-glutamate synthesis protein (capsule biosynthesis protein)